MVASELRIGNWVDPYHNFKGPVRVTSLSENKIITEPCSIGSVNGFVKPIPITEEWLVKLGFVKGEIKNTYSNINWHSDNKNFTLFQSRDKDVVFYYGFENDMWDIDNIIVKHVHQLQNLCFALTQTELTHG